MWSNVSQKVQSLHTIKIFEGNMKKLLPWHLVRITSRKVSFIIKSVVFQAPSKDMGYFEDESLTTHCQNVGIVFKVEFHTSFWHSRITIFKNFELWKVKNQSNFHLQKSICAFESSKKVMDKI